MWCFGWFLCVASPVRATPCHSHNAYACTAVLSLVVRRGMGFRCWAGSEELERRCGLHELSVLLLPGRSALPHPFRLHPRQKQLQWGRASQKMCKLWHSPGGRSSGGRRRRGYCQFQSWQGSCCELSLCRVNFDYLSTNRFNLSMTIESIAGSVSSSSTFHNWWLFCSALHLTFWIGSLAYYFLPYVWSFPNPILPLLLIRISVLWQVQILT